jgi:hypothetical protein
MKTGYFAITLVFLLTALCCQAQSTDPEQYTFSNKRACLGAGYGIPYGGMGLAVDMYFFDSVALSAGVGSYGYAPGWEIGLKYLYGSSQKTWRPTALLIFGINGAINYPREPEDDIREACTGFTAGLGSQFMFGKKKQHGFDIGILYIVSSGVFKRIEYWEGQGYHFQDYSRVSPFLGYRFAFDLKY